MPIVGSYGAAPITPRGPCLAVITKRMIYNRCKPTVVNGKCCCATHCRHSTSH